MAAGAGIFLPDAGAGVRDAAVDGYKAFTQTHVTVDVFVDPAEISEDRLPRGGFDDVLEASLLATLPAGTEADIGSFFSDGAQFRLRDMVVADPGLIGQTVRLTVPVSDPMINWPRTWSIATRPKISAA